MQLTKVVFGPALEKGNTGASAKRVTSRTPDRVRRSTTISSLLVTLKTSLGHNSQFFGLSKQERAQLGSVEYQALRVLFYVVPAYIFIFQFIGTTILAPYMAYNQAETEKANGVNPWYVLSSLNETLTDIKI